MVNWTSRLTSTFYLQRNLAIVFLIGEIIIIVKENVAAMSSSGRRQCRNNPDVFYYICRKYMMTKYRFNVKDLPKELMKHALA